MHDLDHLVFVGAVLLLALHALAYVRWTEDDVAVSLRYAVNLSAGDGLVYNVGERVEAISNIGFVLVLAPFLLVRVRQRGWL